MAINSIANLTDSTVAGSNTQIQYNNSGVFGASSNLTFDGSTLQVGSGIATPNSNGDNLVLNSTGNVGLSILGDTTSSASIIYFGIDGDESDGRIFYQNSATNPFMDFYTADTHRLRIDGNGRMGFGNTTAAGSRYYFSGAEDNGWAIRADNSTATGPNGLYLYFTGTAPDNNSQRFLYCQDTGAARMEVFSDGDVRNHDNSYGAISDERLKQDIVDASSQWDDIKNLRVRKYKFISDVEAYGDDAVAHIGVIAQEAELVSPGLVQRRVSDAVLDDEGNEVEPAVDEYSVQYSVLYMKCVKALQEAMARIETLEAQVAALQGA